MTDEKKSSAQAVGAVMGLYTAMVFGQVVGREDLSMADKVAGVLCMSDVLLKAHAKAIMKLCEKESASPAWLIGPDRLEELAEMYAVAMVEGVKRHG